MTREKIKSDSKDPNIEREENRKKKLKYFVKVSTYSEELKPDTKDDSGNRGTEMGDANYYETKASNKTWAQISSAIELLLGDNLIINSDAVEKCRNFIKDASEKYDTKESGDYPSKMTTSKQLESIKEII
ncbi:MAG: hypothetical protein V1688_05000, partial [bacterium]